MITVINILGFGWVGKRCLVGHVEGRVWMRINASLADRGRRQRAARDPCLPHPAITVLGGRVLDWWHRLVCRELWGDQAYDRTRGSDPPVTHEFRHSYYGSILLKNFGRCSGGDEVIQSCRETEIEADMAQRHTSGRTNFQEAGQPDRAFLTIVHICRAFVGEGFIRHACDTPDQCGAAARIRATVVDRSRHGASPGANRARR